jgi:hypothetical protein
VEAASSSPPEHAATIDEHAATSASARNRRGRLPVITVVAVIG